MKTFLRANLVFLILVNSGNFLGYVFQLVVSRMLDPADFGLFNSLHSLALVATAPIMVLPMVLARFVIDFQNESPEAVRGLFSMVLKKLALTALLLGAVTALAVPSLMVYLHIDSIWPFMILILLLIVSIIYPGFLGVLQGKMLFTAYGTSFFCFALAKMLTAYIFLRWFGWGVNGALFAGVAGVLIGVALTLPILRETISGPKVRPPSGTWLGIMRFSIPVMASSAIFISLGNLDIFFARHLVDELSVGHYATAAIVGRIGMHLTSMIGVVLFPEARKAKMAGDSSLQPLMVSVVLTLLIGGGYTLLCWLAPRQILHLFFGAQYVSAAPLLPIIAAAMSLLSTSNVLFSFFLAKERYSFLWISLPIMCATFAAMQMFSRTPEHIAWTLFAGCLAILVLMAAYLIPNRTNQQHSREPGV